MRTIDVKETWGRWCSCDVGDAKGIAAGQGAAAGASSPGLGGVPRCESGAEDDDGTVDTRTRLTSPVRSARLDGADFPVAARSENACNQRTVVTGNEQDGGCSVNGWMVVYLGGLDGAKNVAQHRTVIT